jgi:hypothetical protein
MTEITTVVVFIFSAPELDIPDVIDPQLRGVEST